MRERLIELQKRVAAPIAVGVVLGLIGPFGTFELLGLMPRLGYWLAIVSLNWFLCDLGIRRVDAYLPDTVPMRQVIAPLTGSLLVAVPATAVVAVANGLSGIGWPEAPGQLFWQVLLLLAAISVPVYNVAVLLETAASAQPSSGQDLASAKESEPAGLKRFSERLPEPLEGTLLCLETHDHYLAVHSTEGKQLVLCRMEDATRELEGLGQRVHRSWWVAQSAVAGIERDGQRLLLRLTDDRRVPVGRTYRNALKASGWIPTPVTQKPD